MGHQGVGPTILRDRVTHEHQSATIDLRDVVARAHSLKNGPSTIYLSPAGCVAEARDWVCTVGDRLETLFVGAGNQRLVRTAFELAIEENTRQFVGVLIADCDGPREFLAQLTPLVQDEIVHQVQLVATPIGSAECTEHATPQLNLDCAVAHELTNSLATIANLSCAAKRQISETDKLFPLVSLLESQAIESARRIKALRFALIGERSEDSHTDINAILRQSVSQLSPAIESTDSSIQLDLADRLPNLRADESQLRMLFDNLVSNAVQTRNPDSIHMVVVTTQLVTPGKGVIVSIANNGDGSRLGDFAFAPGYSTKKDGLGLGLSICQSIVIAHAGELSLMPNDLGGITAECRIPCAGGVS